MSTNSLNPDDIFIPPLDEYDKRPVFYEISDEEEKKRNIDHRNYIISQRDKKAKYFKVPVLTEEDYKNAKLIGLSEEDLDKNYYQESKWNKKAWLHKIIEILDKDNLKYLPILKLRNEVQEILNDIHSLKESKKHTKKLLHNIIHPKNEMTPTIDTDRVNNLNEQIKQLKDKINIISKDKIIELKQILSPTKTEIVHKHIKKKSKNYTYGIMIVIFTICLGILIYLNEFLKSEIDNINKIISYVLLSGIIITCVFKLYKTKNKYKID